MIVTCPDCDKQYLIEEKNLPRVKSAARCKECGGRIIIDPAAVAVPADGAARPAQETSAAPEAAGADATAGREFSLEELLASFPWLGEVNRESLELESIFIPDPAKGFAGRRNRRAAAAIKAVFGCLPALLAPDEKIVKAALGDGYFPAEIPYANTLLTLPANRFAILCTDRRILVINLDQRRSRCGELFYQFPYANIRETGRGPFRDSLSLRSRSGRVMRFTGLGRALSREMEETILGLRRTILNWNIVPVAPECLCPACFTPQACDNETCPSCGAVFKSPTTAFFRSLVLPGLGAAYLRHRLLAAGELFTTAMICTAGIVLYKVGLPGGSLLAACALVLFAAASSACVLFLGRKGLMLAETGAAGGGEKEATGDDDLQNRQPELISPDHGKDGTSDEKDAHEEE